jgi:hypothetical protein
MISLDLTIERRTSDFEDGTSILRLNSNSVEELGQHRHTHCITYFADYILPICRTICDCRFFRHITDISIQSSLIYTDASSSLHDSLFAYHPFSGLNGKLLAPTFVARALRSPAVYVIRLAELVLPNSPASRHDTEVNHDLLCLPRRQRVSSTKLSIAKSTFAAVHRLQPHS